MKKEVARPLFNYMKAAKFYIMPDSFDSGGNALLKAACQIIATHYLRGERVFMLTKDQAQAEAADQCLWQFDAQQFVPHNLTGEGPSGGAPVEIGWQPPRQRRQTLINLAPQAPSFAVNYAQIIDFVPGDETGKQQARERYKIYRQLGIELQTQPYDIQSAE
jgi:DNA polymerase-3 subunit chi